MKKAFIITIFALLLTVSLASATPNPGAIWTTNGDCGDANQNVNQFAVGDTVFINGNNFGYGDRDWDITGKPGQASCDPNIAVASGVFDVDESGSFCFEAYAVEQGDCGEYGVDFDGKKDNYKVEKGEPVDEVPEFGIIGALAVLGLAGIYIYKKRN